ncbi:MAG TPA: hypothetical protein VNN25_21265 [Thermoanaerobaculia bacterium]|nr:hypothetical protein [Thermoanaerobaculia bacterium]
MRRGNIKRSNVWRSVVLAVALALTGISPELAASPSVARIANAWRHIEPKAALVHTQPPARLPVAAASVTRKRAAAPPPLPACAAGVVAHLVEVGDLATDDKYIYFVDGEDLIARVAKEGGTPTLLGEVPGALIVSMTTDDARIYFTTWDDDSLTGSIYSIAKDGGPVRALVRGLATPFDLTVDGQFVYWLAVGTSAGDGFLADGAIGRAAKADGSGVLKLASNLSLPVSLTLDATNVYYSETGAGLGNPSVGLRRVPLAGGPISKLVDGIIVGPVAVDSATVYYGTLTGSGTFEIASLPKSGGNPRLLVSGLDDISSLKLFGSTLYYVSESDETSINAVPAAGGARRMVRTGGLATAKIAIEECLLYFASDENSTLERIPR